MFLKSFGIKTSLALLVLIAPLSPANAQTTTVNMSTYASDCTAPKTICIDSFAKAIKAAKTWYKTNPGGTYNLDINAGTYDFSDETTDNGSSVNGAIDVSGIFPTGTGSFNLVGAGSSTTTLITSNGLETFHGTSVSHIHISGLTLRRGSMTVTQGVVTATGPGYVTIQIPSGFPLATDLYVAGSGIGRYLRVYDNSNPANPVMNTDPSNTQVPYGANTAPTCTGNSCTYYLNNTSLVVPAIYTAANQIVGVKAEGEGQAYYFANLGGTGGEDVGFNDIIWYDMSRGVWRNITSPYVTNSQILRRAAIGGQQPAMSTPSGGPQFGQPGDTYTLGNILVNNFTAVATGDDTIAVFNDTTSTSTLENTTIYSGFARTINLDNSCHVGLSNNTGYYCSPQFDHPTEYNGCITDTSDTPCTNFPL